MKYLITLQALPSVKNPELALRRLLKFGLRTLGLKCVGCKEGGQSVFKRTISAPEADEKPGKLQGLTVPAPQRQAGYASVKTKR